MRLKKSNSIEIAAAAKDVETAKAFVGKRLKRSNISREVRSETMLVLDALLRNLLRQGFDPDRCLSGSLFRRDPEPDQRNRRRGHGRHRREACVEMYIQVCI